MAYGLGLWHRAIGPQGIGHRTGVYGSARLGQVQSLRVQSLESRVQSLESLGLDRQQIGLQVQVQSSLGPGLVQSSQSLVKSLQVLQVQVPRPQGPRSQVHFETSKCASHHNGVHFFHSSTSKSGPNMTCFDTLIDSPKCAAALRHNPQLNFQKCSETDMF